MQKLGTVKSYTISTRRLSHDVGLTNHRNERLPEMEITEIKADFAQVNTPPPNLQLNANTNLPVPKGFMHVCFTGLNEVEECRKETKLEQVIKPIPTGIKRKREEKVLGKK